MPVFHSIPGVYEAFYVYILDLGEHTKNFEVMNTIQISK